MPIHDLERIEEKLDRAVAGAVEVSDGIGGIAFKDMAQVMEFAKLLSLAGSAIPKHLRGNPGACLAVTIQAIEWRSSPIAVANKSYEVNDRIAYESQLIVAIINTRAPLKERLRYIYEGEGVEMKCTVTGLLKGEASPLPYESPKIKDIKVKNSPLWQGDPRQQLGYFSARAWARRHCPETILGIYSDDELEGVGADRARDVTPATDKPSIGTRLSGKGKQAGFDGDNVTKALEAKPEPQVLDTGIKPKQEMETVQAAGQQVEQAPVKGHEAQTLQEEQKPVEIDIEAELAAKKEAILNCHTKADLRDLTELTTDMLKEAGRTDLLNDFMSAVVKREKKLKS